MSPVMMSRNSPSIIHSSSMTSVLEPSAQALMQRHATLMDPSQPLLASQQPLIYEVREDGSIVLFTTDSVSMMCPYEKIPVVTVYKTSPGEVKLQ
ncbi:hypothetical protein HDU67_006300, partial [Dinochytrium kinnereticum]